MIGQFNFSDAELNEITAENLGAELERLKSERSKIRSYQIYAPISSAIILVICIFIYMFFHENPIWLFIGVSYLVIGVGFFIAPFSKTFEDNIELIENEIQLAKSEIGDLEVRAERLFRSHEIELRKYYKQNLNLGAWIFATGIMCILLGFSVVFYTNFSLWNSAHASTSELIKGGFGLISGILINFVAVIFLKMFSGITSSTNSFHERLVTTNNLYYANFLTSKISDQKLRDEAISNLAQK